MTQEEKAKRYDIALDKIKMLLGRSSSCSREELEYVFPELKESEDERIRKEIIATIHLYYGEPLEDEAKEMIAWLEKQGEQNLANSAKICKVEPKFKVGDWVIDVQGVSSNQIIGYEDDSYYIETSCSKFYLPMKLAEKNYRLWTIQDAKDGDVLYNKDGFAGNSVFMYKDISEKTHACLYYTRLFKDKDFSIYNDVMWENGVGVNGGEFYPATREQRGNLMKAMADAGYTFDFDKKN